MDDDEYVEPNNAPSIYNRLDEDIVEMKLNKNDSELDERVINISPDDEQSEIQDDVEVAFASRKKRIS